MAGSGVPSAQHEVGKGGVLHPCIHASMHMGAPIHKRFTSWRMLASETGLRLTQSSKSTLTLPMKSAYILYARWKAVMRHLAARPLPVTARAMASLGLIDKHAAHSLMHARFVCVIDQVCQQVLLWQCHNVPRHLIVQERTQTICKTPHLDHTCMRAGYICISVHPKMQSCRGHQ
jgi:hypothetical protein